VQAVLGVRRQDKEYGSAVGSRAVDYAALETQEMVKDAAKAREGLPTPATDPDNLGRELRAERTTASPCIRRRA